MRLRFDGQKFLVIYSAVLTTVLVASVSVGMSETRRQQRLQRFEEIDVQRINVVEPDGTVRLVLSGKATFPGLVFEGKEYPHPNRKTAGILFFNDEGTEHGGIVFGGETGEDGEVDAYGHLSFDQYEQDQVVTLNATESGGRRKAGLSIWDRPDYSTEELLLLMERTKDQPDAERKAALAEFHASRESPHPRLYLGKGQSGAVSLRLNDPEGRERLVVEVGADGSPFLLFLDEEGEEVARFPAKADRGE